MGFLTELLERYENEQSPLVKAVTRSVREHGLRVTRIELQKTLAELSPLELAALDYQWEGFWARPKQVIHDGPWRSWTDLGGRGTGKTGSRVHFALKKIAQGRARRIALVAQSVDKTIEIFITGETGFLCLTPPWMGVDWHPADGEGLLTFANGATARVFTAQEPKGFNGPQHDLVLASELGYWPKADALLTFDTMNKGLRLGDAQLVCDSTPLRRAPLIRLLTQRAAADPETHRLVISETGENWLNLSPKSLHEQYIARNSPKGEEDWFGRFHDELENGMFVETDLNRAHAPPARYVERIIAVDPSTAGKKHSDAIGIIEAGLGDNDVCYVLANLGGKLDINQWPDMVLDRYAASKCSRLILETNHAGTTWGKIFSDACRLRGWRYNEVPLEAPTRSHEPGVLCFSPFAVGNGQSKAERAQTAANFVRAGRVSFVEGALGALKEQLCDFTGDDNRLDDEVDAFVHAVTYLVKNSKNPRAAFIGLPEVTKALAQATKESPRAPIMQSITAAFRGRPSTI